METKQTIIDGTELLKTIPFNEFTDKVNNSFNALLMLSELYKSANPDLVEILNTVENGR